MAWRNIKGYKYPYRISDQGEVQKWSDGSWKTLVQNIENNRAEVRLRTIDGKQQKVGVFRLMDRMFQDGYADKNGLLVGPKNGVKTECTLENMAYKKQSDVGRTSLSRTMRKAVIRYGRDGSTTIYSSVTEAAKKNGLTKSSLDRRLYKGVLDPRGYRFEVDV